MLEISMAELLGMSEYLCLKQESHKKGQLDSCLLQ